MVKLRVAARIIPEDSYLATIDTPSARTTLAGERKLAVIVREPESWYVGTLANEIKDRYRAIYKHELGQIKYLKDNEDDCDLDPSFNVAELLVDEGKAAQDGYDQHVTIKVVQEQGRDLRFGSVVPDLSRVEYNPEHNQNRGRVIPPVPKFPQTGSVLGKRASESRSSNGANGANKRTRREGIEETQDVDIPVTSIETDAVQEDEDDRHFGGEGSPELVQESQAAPHSAAASYQLPNGGARLKNTSRAISGYYTPVQDTGQGFNGTSTSRKRVSTSLADRANENGNSLPKRLIQKQHLGSAQTPTTPTSDAPQTSSSARLVSGDSQSRTPVPRASSASSSKFKKVSETAPASDIDDSQMSPRSKKSKLKQQPQPVSSRSERKSTRPRLPIREVQGLIDGDARVFESSRKRPRNEVVHDFSMNVSGMVEDEEDGSGAETYGEEPEAANNQVDVAESESGSGGSDGVALTIHHGSPEKQEVVDRQSDKESQDTSEEEESDRTGENETSNTDSDSDNGTSMPGPKPRPEESQTTSGTPQTQPKSSISSKQAKDKSKPIQSRPDNGFAAVSQSYTQLARQESFMSVDESQGTPGSAKRKRKRQKKKSAVGDVSMVVDSQSLDKKAQPSAPSPSASAADPFGKKKHQPFSLEVPRLKKPRLSNASMIDSPGEQLYGELEASTQVQNRSDVPDLLKATAKAKGDKHKSSRSVEEHSNKSKPSALAETSESGVTNSSGDQPVPALTTPKDVTSNITNRQKPGPSYKPELWSPSNGWAAKLCCPVRGCARQDQSFSRRDKLLSHLKTQHPQVDVEEVKLQFIASRSVNPSSGTKKPEDSKPKAVDLPRKMNGSAVSEKGMGLGVTNSPRKEKTTSNHSQKEVDEDEDGSTASESSSSSESEEIEKVAPPKLIPKGMTLEQYEASRKKYVGEPYLTAAQKLERRKSSGRSPSAAAGSTNGKSESPIVVVEQKAPKVMKSATNSSFAASENASTPIATASKPTPTAKTSSESKKADTSRKTPSASAKGANPPHVKQTIKALTPVVPALRETPSVQASESKAQSAKSKMKTPAPATKPVQNPGINSLRAIMMEQSESNKSTPSRQLVTPANKSKAFKIDDDDDDESTESESESEDEVPKKKKVVVAQISKPDQSIRNQTPESDEESDDDDDDEDS